MKARMYDTPSSVHFKSHILFFLAPNRYYNTLWVLRGEHIGVTMTMVTGGSNPSSSNGTQAIYLECTKGYQPIALWTRVNDHLFVFGAYTINSQPNHMKLAFRRSLWQKRNVCSPGRNLAFLLVAIIMPVVEMHGIGHHQSTI